MTFLSQRQLTTVSLSAGMLLQRLLTAAGLLQRQLTTSNFAAFYYDFTRFGRKIKINRNLFRILRNFIDPLYIFF